MALTGRFEFRRTWTGKVVLRIEEEIASRFLRARPYRRWRDASLTDLMQEPLGPLLDLKNGARHADTAPAATPYTPTRAGRATFSYALPPAAELEVNEFCEGADQSPPRVPVMAAKKVSG